MYAYACVCMHVYICVENSVSIKTKICYTAQEHDEWSFSSRQPDGSKQFRLEGVEFGWQAIMDMYSRECERRSKGVARMVPRLREVHVLRDAWTKLNVHPANIQVHVCIDNYD